MKAIYDNDFLKFLTKLQVNEIVDCMYESHFTKDQFICREGSVGTQLYVISCELILVALFELLPSF